MICHIVHDSEPVGLVGGGPVTGEVLNCLFTRTRKLVAADGGATHLTTAGRMPDAVIGDFDSLSPVARAALPENILHQIAEQDSTDFEKCLCRIDAPLILAAGFTGGRADHGLAALHGLLAWPDRRCVLLGDEDLLFLSPPVLQLELAAGTRFSLMPLAPVTAQSTGLHWPLSGRGFAPGRRIGTSNRVAGAGSEPVQITVTCDVPAMLVILPRLSLDAVIRALAPSAGRLGAAGSGWPARAR